MKISVNRKLWLVMARMSVRHGGIHIDHHLRDSEGEDEG